jgi:hypothetical protein
MANSNSTIPRKKFLIWGAGLSALLAIPSFLKFRKKTPLPQSVKMLTQDGKLVEIDIAHMPSKTEKISKSGLQTWVHKKNTLL